MLNRRFSPTCKPHAKALHLLFIAALLALALGTAPAKPVQADPAPLAGAVSPGGLLNPDGTLDTTTGFQGTLDLRGWEVTLDGERGPLFKPASRSAAAPIAWHALPNKGFWGDVYGSGYYGNVYSLVVSGDDLYVGGYFYQTGDGTLKNLGNIARYDTTAGTWHALPNQGLNDFIFVLAVSGNDLYVGGWFEETGDGTLKNLGNIARYDTTAGTWHALPNQGLHGLWARVFVLAVSGDDLYVGGDFEETGDGTLKNLGNIARYDTTAGTWHALPHKGLDSSGDGGSVGALAVSGDDLYVGGWFDQTGDWTLKGLGNIVRYDTTTGTWHALPNQGLDGSKDPPSSVGALAVSGNDLYVGGRFFETGNGALTDLGNIARYDTTAGTWHALPHKGLGWFVNALAVSGSDLYVGGWFRETGDRTLTDLGYIVRYDTTAGAWHALPNQGLYGMRGLVGVETLVVSGSDLYVGGRFDQTGDGSLKNLGYIARCTLVVNVYLPLVFAK